MYYRDFLGRIHELLEPPTYLEIGVRNGDSLALARSPSIGIDPAYNLKVAPPPGAKLFPVTSDDFFERAEPLMTFEGRRVGFSFIDGMHLSEFALRDFVNVERHADWTARDRLRRHPPARHPGGQPRPHDPPVDRRRLQGARGRSRSTGPT